MHYIYEWRRGIIRKSEEHYIGLFWFIVNILFFLVFAFPMLKIRVILNYFTRKIHMYEHI